MEGLVVDGILAGVGGVLTFVPVLFGLYTTLAILEDTGYMARAALVMDRAMRAIGIPGKAFLPMMVGFGCTVPAIYATRTLDSHRDRLLTGLLVPFMSCSARLPVYVLLASIFFAANSGSVVFAMYVLGVVVAIVVGLALGRTMLRDDDPAPFVMVLPDYRLPNVRTVWSLVKRRTWAFIEGAGTMILVASIAVWLLLAIPVGGGSFGSTEVEDSAFGTVAGAFAPGHGTARLRGMGADRSADVGLRRQGGRRQHDEPVVRGWTAGETSAEFRGRPRRDRFGIPRRHGGNPEGDPWRDRPRLHRRRR